MNFVLWSFLCLLFVGLCLLQCFIIDEWCISGRMLGYPLSDLSFVFLLDGLSWSFAYMLGGCVLVALYYSWHYSGNLWLVPLMLGFGGVMLLLVFTGSFITSLVLWEYLGLLSFLLILFYSNLAGLRAAVITLFASRFGDVSFFVVLAWSYYMWDISSWWFVLSIFLIVSTKSALYPFISWLLEAMRAPTPVSSLVHSSTLVTAGVWFLLRYESWFSSTCLFLLCLFSIVSIVVSGVCALYCDDLKKVVALSTCSNVSWCVIFDVFGSLELAVVQLLIHGISKCYLFMSVGDLICGGFGSQAIFSSRGHGYLGLWCIVSSAVLVFSLCGLPFMGVFYTKHVLLSSGVLFSFNLVIGLLLFVGLLLTYAYSFRFFVLLVAVRVPGVSFGEYDSFVLSGIFGTVGSFLSYLGVLLIPGNWSIGIWGDFVLLVLPLVGWVIGIVLSVVSSNCIGFSRVVSSLCSGVFGGDVIVLFVCRLLNGISVLCLWASYRWEVFLVRSVFDSVVEDLIYSMYVALFSLGILVVAVVVSLSGIYLFSVG